VCGERNRNGRAWAAYGRRAQPVVSTQMLSRKGSRVVPFIVETLGGICPHALAYVGHMARRAKQRGMRDSTVYGTSRTASRSFFTHHIQQISLAAQRGDAKGIRQAVLGWKQRSQRAARSA
jgi:hypothetical protein